MNDKSLFSISDIKMRASHKRGSFGLYIKFLCGYYITLMLSACVVIKLLSDKYSLYCSTASFVC